MGRSADSWRPHRLAQSARSNPTAFQAVGFQHGFKTMAGWQSIGTVLTRCMTSSTTSSGSPNTATGAAGARGGASAGFDPANLRRARSWCAALTIPYCSTWARAERAGMGGVRQDHPGREPAGPERHQSRSRPDSQTASPASGRAQKQSSLPSV